MSTSKLKLLCCRIWCRRSQWSGRDALLFEWWDESWRCHQDPSPRQTEVLIKHCSFYRVALPRSNLPPITRTEWVHGEYSTTGQISMSFIATKQSDDSNPCQRHPEFLDSLQAKCYYGSKKKSRPYYNNRGVLRAPVGWLKVWRHTLWRSSVRNWLSMSQSEW